MTNQYVQRDAAAFGRVEQKTNEQQWDQALRVARSCTDGRKISGEISKVTMAEFSRLAGVSRTTVTRYFAAWERATAEWDIPRAADLEPGQNVTVPDASFAQYHTRHSDAAGLGSGGQPTTREVTRSIAANPSKLTQDAAAAIAADPVAARLVADALADTGLAKTRDQKLRQMIREHRADDETAEDLAGAIFNHSISYLFGEQGKRWKRDLESALRREVDVTPKQVEALLADLKDLAIIAQVFAVRAGGDLDAEYAEVLGAIG